MPLSLKNDETFEIIQSIDDWNEYFDTIRQQLTEEYDALNAEEAMLLE